MKKLLALVLAMMMVLSLAACGNSGGNAADAGIKEVDLSKYPADLKDWNAQNLLDYFKEAADLPSDWEEWYRDATWYMSEPIHEDSGIWNDDGSVQLMIYIFDPNAADTTPEAVEEVLEALRTDSTHSYITDDWWIGPATHLVGNILFDYESTTDEAYYNMFEAAYQQLISTFELTADF